MSFAHLYAASLASALFCVAPAHSYVQDFKAIEDTDLVQEVTGEAINHFALYQFVTNNNKLICDLDKGACLAPLKASKEASVGVQPTTQRLLNFEKHIIRQCVYKPYIRSELGVNQHTVPLYFIRDRRLVTRYRGREEFIDDFLSPKVLAARSVQHPFLSIGSARTTCPSTIREAIEILIAQIKNAKESVTASFGEQEIPVVLSKVLGRLGARLESFSGSTPAGDVEGMLVTEIDERHSFDGNRIGVGSVVLAVNGRKTTSLLELAQAFLLTSDTNKAAISFIDCRGRKRDGGFQFYGQGYARPLGSAYCRER